MNFESDTHVHARRLARAISNLLNLPHDDSLAFVIGNGSERTSEEAVASWLEQKHADTLHLSIDDVCAHLSVDLERLLDKTS